MAAKGRPDVLLVARQTVTVDAGDGKAGYALLAGVTRLPSSHPVARARPELFVPVEPAAQAEGHKS